MAPDEYTQALDRALADLKDKVLKRDLLSAEIAGLKETVRVLSSRVELSKEKQTDVAKLIALVDSATPNLTDAVRSLLTSVYPEAMTAVEVRNELERSVSYDDSSISLSACHAALKRMLTEKEVEYGPVKDGKSSFRRVLEIERPLHNLSALHSMLGGVGSTLPRIAEPSNPPRMTIGQHIAEAGKVGIDPKPDSAYESGMRGNEKPHQRLRDVLGRPESWRSKKD